MKANKIKLNINFKDRALTLNTQANEVILRHFLQICKIKYPHPLLLGIGGGRKVDKTKGKAESLSQSICQSVSNKK